MIGNRDMWLFAALSIVWGSAFVAIEVGLETLPPILFAALRFDVAALIFVTAVFLLDKPWRPRTPADWTLVGVGGVLIVGAHFALSFVGQSYVTSAVAAIVLSSVPIITPPIAVALLPRERIRVPTAVGIVVGLLGVAVIALPGGQLDGQAIGVGLLLASAVVFALGSVLSQRTRATLPLVTLQAWSMGIGAVVLHALSAIHPGESIRTLEMTPSALVSLAYLAVVATAGGFFVYFLLLERIGATELSLVNYVVPAVAAVVGWATLGETITATTVLGFGLIVFAFGLCKIGALWRTAAPVVGYGPHRPTATADGIVVDGNIYVERPREEKRSAPGDATRSDRPAASSLQ